VLVGREGCVVGSCLDGEVVEELALVDSGSGLGYELSAKHSLAVPLCSLIDGDFSTLLGGGIRRVLEGSAEVDIFVDGAGAMDVVLVGTDRGGEGPFVQVGAGGHVVEAAIPDDGAYQYQYQTFSW
jgi:hypothetical protein